MKLHANVFGEGASFIILHGFLGMSDNWKTVGKRIAEHGYEVHLIDQRNHGRSPHSEEFKYQLMADDLLEYCTLHGLKNSILLGHSMGGKTAMLFSTQHPGSLKKLIIADIGPKQYPEHHQDILEGLNSLNFEKLKTRTEVDKALSAYITDMGVRMFLMKNLFWKTKEKLGLRINLKSLTNNISEIGKELAINKQYIGETLFLKGQKSKYILKEDTGRIKEHFPNADIVEIINAGHWLHAENPDEFLKKVFDFLKKN